MIRVRERPGAVEAPGRGTGCVAGKRGWGMLALDVGVESAVDGAALFRGMGGVGVEWALGMGMGWGGVGWARWGGIWRWG